MREILNIFNPLHYRSHCRSYDLHYSSHDRSHDGSHGFPYRVWVWCIPYRVWVWCGPYGVPYRVWVWCGPYLMVIWGRSPLSGFSSMRISRMVWDQ